MFSTARLSQVRRWLASSGAAALVLCGAASAADIPLPPIDAPYAFVGDPLRGMDPGDTGSLFEVDADFSKGMASTTKSWSMYLVSKAVDDGLLDLDDIVTLSGNALIPRCHGHSQLSGPSTPVAGDQYRLDDLLIALLVDSASDGTLGSAEYLADLLSPGLTAAEREAYFVGLMNDAAANIGLTDTVFFNPYGGDHLHSGTCSAGAAVPHRSTAREMAKWYAHAVEDSPTFRELNAFRGSRVVTSLDGMKTHALNAYGPVYPGLVGIKPGGNASCSNCLIGAARRLGRDMSFGFMDPPTNGSNDGTELLDYAYATTFQPEWRAASAKWGPVKDHALANVGPSRAVAAVITEDDKYRLITWAVDANAGTIQQIRQGLPSPCAGGTLPWSPGNSGDGTGTGTPGDVASGSPANGGGRRAGNGRDDDGRDDASGGDRSDDTGDGRGDEPGGGAGPGGLTPGGHSGALPPGQGGYATNEKPLAVDIVHAGSGNLVVAIETTLGLQLLSYGLPACNEPFLRDTMFAGMGHDPELQVMEPGLFVLGHRDADDTLVLRSFRVDLSSGQFSQGPLATTEGPVVSEFDLSGREKVFLSSNLVAAAVGADFLRVLSWTVTSDGQFHDGSVLSGPNASLVSVSHVEGFDDFRDAYVVAYRSFSGQLWLRVYDMAINGDLQFLTQATDGSWLVEEDGATAIASYDERGVLVAFKRDVIDQVTTLVALSVDEDLNNLGNLDANAVVEEETSLSSGPPVLVRLPTGQAEGDFLVLQQDFFEVDQPLQLELYRSGPRH